MVDLGKKTENLNITPAFISILLGFIVSLINISPVLFKNNIVQDDFNQSYFWVWTYWDKDLFKDYFFVEMYQSHLVRTPLLNFIFHLGPYITDNLIFFSKLLAMFVGTLSTFFAYLFFFSLTKNKFLTFVFTLTMSFVFWFTDHVPNGCTRSYLWAGLYGYMYFKLSGKNLIASILNFVLLFVSPFTFLLCLGMEFFNLILRLDLKNLLSSIKNNFISMFALSFNALAAAVLYLVIFKEIKTQGSGKTFSLNEMRYLPEFNIYGRHNIFGVINGTNPWYNNKHWGLPLGELNVFHLILFIIISILIAFYLCRNKNKVKNIFTGPVIALLYSSLSLYFMAQVFFPLLFMPNRYIMVPLLLLVTLLPFLFFCEILRKCEKNNFLKIEIITICLIAIFIFKSTNHSQFVEMNAQIKHLVEVLPKDSVIASHPNLIDLCLTPAVTRRMSFVDKERSIAYSMPELKEIRRRTKVSFKIIYSGSKEEIVSLMKKNKIDYLLVNSNFYKKKYLDSPWYYRPYNKFLRELIKSNKEKGFYLQKLLKQKNEKYILIELNELI